MHLPVLSTIAIIFGVTSLIVIICRYLRIPYIIGFLLTGIIVSPHTWGILNADTEVEEFSEIGVILLLFSVGLEFSIKNLLKIKRYVLMGGFIQVGGTILLATLISAVFGVALQSAVFYGFIIACSSTAIVIKLLQDRIEINTEYGKLVLAILLFQDVIIVPLMLFLPLLSGQEANWAPALLILLAKMAGLIIGAILAAKYLIPPFLKLVMKVKSQEVFLIATVFLVATITTITSEIGLSLALGAFIAGLIISETDYNHLAISCFLPFRYVFISFFFISMGMLLDYQVALHYPLLIITIFLMVLILKFLIAFVAGRMLKVSIENSLKAALIISQVGEFSFVLAKEGFNLALISEINYQIFITVAILTMIVTPYMIQYASKISMMFIDKLNYEKQT